LCSGVSDRRGDALAKEPRRVRDHGPERARAPGVRALALAGNRVTRKRIEDAGVEVVEYDGDEISRKGDGGPTCLTLPVDFGASGSS
jgi:hypothetical protein